MDFIRPVAGFFHEPKATPIQCVSLLVTSTAVLKLLREVSVIQLSPKLLYTYAEAIQCSKDKSKRKNVTRWFLESISSLAEISTIDLSSKLQFWGKQGRAGTE